MSKGSMNKEEELLAKRIQDLAGLADRTGRVTFTDFLNLNEQNILHQTLQKFSWIRGETFGGYEGAERQIAAFVPDAFSYPPAYPITCIRITPLNRRFAEELSHRDILGALMRLGIERSKMGDIALCQEESFLFCHQDMAEVIRGDLTRIRHTSVKCELCDLTGFHYQPKLQPLRGSVASVRLDAVMAVAFQASRSSLLSLIGGGYVFVNGRLVTSNGYALKEGDIISARGYGKFRFDGAVGQTKKGRCMVEIQKYI